MQFLLPILPAFALFAQSGITQGAASHLLQILYVAAAVLGLTLFVVVAIAVIAWRKNKDTDLTP